MEVEAESEEGESTRAEAGAEPGVEAGAEATHVLICFATASLTARLARAPHAL